MRAAGAATVYFDLYLKARVGEPSAPADPAGLVDKANKLFDYAANQIGCPTPTIVENELFGAGLVTPWSETNARYRQNVLTFLGALAARGAHPVLLVNSPPYTAGDAGVWWQQVAQVADIVREDYVPANAVWKKGPILGNRQLRNAYRQSIQDFTAIGIPPQRLGVMVSFSTTPGFGGRNGLQPRDAWLQVAKWQALAAQTVAAETGIGSIWSWGWAEWSAAEKDPDKLVAACVWLWARNPSLCDGPGQAGAGFDASRTEGQFRLGTDVQCTVDGRGLSNDAIQKLQLVTGERDTAYSAIYQRLIESDRVPVSSRDVLDAERAVIAQAFKGSRAAYVSALRQAHASVEVARGVLGDQLRRAKLETTFFAGRPSAKEIQTFYESYPELLVRMVQSSPSPAWLGDQSKGLALSEVAPNWLFALKTGKGGRVRTASGVFTVKALADALPLGAVPLGQAAKPIQAALRTFARGAAYDKWSISRQRFGLNDAICARDDLPQPASVDLTSYLPFLRLG
jgi:hypothetical protein